MNNDVVIRVDHVSKKYCKSLKRSMFYGLSDIANNMVGLGSRPEALRQDEFWAVDDVSFELKRGETLGLIGANGSGKTTLLKMLNGIFWPDKGKITVRGRVGALIAVGAGFHPVLTGRENIYVNGAILGMSKQELDKKFDAIVDFADIGDFLDTPVKHYSSGMFVRLGFAVAAYCEPDVLLVDEVLAVGDVNFQRKCFNMMKSTLAAGTAVILVSHSAPSILSFCSNGLLLDHAKVKSCGNIFKVMHDYNNLMDEQRLVELECNPSRNKKSSSDNIIIEDIKICGLDGNEFREKSVPLFSPFSFIIKYRTDLVINKPLIWGDILKDNVLVSIFGGYFLGNSNKLPDILPNVGRIKFSIVAQSLTPGAYLFRFGIRSKDAYFYEELINNSLTFRVFDEKKSVVGFLYNKEFFVYLNNDVEVESLD